VSTLDAKAYSEAQRVLDETDRLMILPLAMGAEELGIPKPSCHECTEAACCTITIFATLFEVLPLAHFIKSVDGFDTPELRARLRDQGFRMETTTPDEWFEQREPCVFLRDGKCSVYPYRPTRCRSYWVFSPAEMCKPPSGQRVKFANYSRATSMVLGSVREAHQQLGLHETRKRILLASVPRMTLIALEGTDPDANLKKLIRSTAWPSDETITGWIAGAPPADAVARLSEWKGAPL